MPRGRQHRQKEPQHLLGAEEVQGSQAAHSKMQSPRPCPGLLAISVCSFPNPKLWALLALLLPRAKPACLRVSGPCFWFQGHDSLLSRSGPCPAEGQPQKSPGPGASPSPSSLSFIICPPQSPQSPWHLSPTLTSHDSAALCPRPAFQPPPWPPPASPPTSWGWLLGEAVISLPVIIGLGLRESELRRGRSQASHPDARPQRHSQKGSLVRGALGATTGIPVTRCHQLCVHVCV